MTDSEEVDFNEAVEGIVLSEEHTRRTAYNEAFKAGQEQGFQEGFPHGLIRGARLASEVGYYRGFSIFWKNFLSNKNHIEGPTGQSPSKVDRQIASLTKLRHLSEIFPKENLQEDLEAKLLELRSRFKQTCSLLSIDPKSCWPIPQNQEVF